MASESAPWPRRPTTPERATAAPSTSATLAHADPSQCKTETSVVSMANCAPPNRGSPSESQVCASQLGSAQPSPLSRTIMFVTTFAPPSRQILTATLDSDLDTVNQVCSAQFRELASCGTSQPLRSSQTWSIGDSQD